jgi:hypothetical protein
LRDALLKRHELIGHEITDVWAAAAGAAAAAAAPKVIDLRDHADEVVGTAGV